MSKHIALVGSSLASAGLAAVLGISGCDGAGTTDAPSHPTYHEHVEAIIQQHCVTCHQAGGIGPFPLTNYEEVSSTAATIADQVDKRTMPPFHVDASGDCNEYKDPRVLSDTEIATIDNWVKTGKPEGDPSKAPPAFKGLPGLDRVTAKLDPGVDYLPNQNADDDYRCFIVDPNIDSDKFVTGYEVHPGTTSEVHHVVVYATDSPEEAAQAKQLDDGEEGPGYTCFGGSMTGTGRVLAVWAPGTGATLYPSGTGLRLKAHQPVVVQVHYNKPTTTDRTTIDLQLDDSVPKEAFITGAFDLSLYLQPGMENQTVSQTGALPATLYPYRIWGVYPHMHKLGKTLRVDLTTGLENKCLVDVPDYQFGWQQFFFYKDPIVVQPNAGSAITIQCGYDTRGVTGPVSWGEGTEDEMCIAGLYVSL